MQTLSKHTYKCGHKETQQNTNIVFKK